MISLTTPIQSLPGMTDQLAEKFSRLGITTVRDALWHFPIRHEDWRQVVPIIKLQPDTKVTVAGQLVKIQTRRSWRKRVQVTEAVVTDDSRGKLKVMWFNQPYLATWLKPGTALFLSGRTVRRRGGIEMHQPMFQRVVRAQPTHERLVPVYPATSGLTQWQIRKLLRQAVGLVNLLTDPLPVSIQQANDLIPLAEALSGIHFPTDPAMAAVAVRRLKFDELLAWQLAWQGLRHQADQPPAPQIPFQTEAVRGFVQSLPFTLTPDQRQAAWDIIQDLGRAEPMARLIQGDVGSGKTVVAAIAAVNAHTADWQSVLLAPTVVLAHQHAQTLLPLLQPHGIDIALLAGPNAAINGQAVPRSELAARLSDGKIRLLIATHAAFDKSLAWTKLGLVMVDEQQRFGVRQRQWLIQHVQREHRVTPHFLSLTATPIPRTLALFLTGELAISSLRQKPPGRQPIATHVIGPVDRARVDREIRDTTERHEQVFVITSLIEESDAFGVRAATTEYDRLRENFSHLRIGLVHGQLPADQRVHLLEQFRQHQLDLLVSTTVIEVGVDVPNATLMVIEGAERFGLAQLHQLRGRIGRGTKASTCLLATDEDTPAVRQRLEKLAATQDGFAVAEMDLAYRGSGDVYGVRQSGLPAWRLATLDDAELFAATRTAATELLSAPVDSPEFSAIAKITAGLAASHHE